MVLFQEALFPRVDLENWLVHRIGMVACFISEMVYGKYFGAEISLK